MQAFFEAGQAWREAGRLGMAFVMLNRFLDLCDAMEEPDSSAAVRGKGGHFPTFSLC